jgi:hypothetical protein
MRLSQKGFLSFQPQVHRVFSRHFSLSLMAHYIGELECIFHFVLAALCAAVPTGSGQQTAILSPDRVVQREPITTALPIAAGKAPFFSGHPADQTVYDD